MLLCTVAILASSFLPAQAFGVVAMSILPGESPLARSSSRASHQHDEGATFHTPKATLVLPVASNPWASPACFSTMSSASSSSMSSPLAIMDVEKEHPPAPPAVRIRINRKMPRPLAYQNLDRVRSKLDMCKQMWKVNRLNEERYINWRRAEVRTHGVSADYYAVRRQIRLEWLHLSCSERSNWVKAFSHRDFQAGKVNLQPWMLPVFVVGNAPASLVKDFSLAPGCLFTFNRGWLLDRPDWCDLVKDLQDSPAELVKQARKREDTMALFDRFSEQADCFAKWAGWQAWSVSLEISLDSEDLGRVHLHAFASFGVSSFQVGRKAFRFGFDQLCPDRRWCKGRKGPAGKDKALGTGTTTCKLRRSARSR